MHLTREHFVYIFYSTFYFNDTRDVLANEVDVILHNCKRVMRISDEAITQSRQCRWRESEEAVDRRYESLKGYDGVIVLRLTAPLGNGA